MSTVHLCLKDILGMAVACEVIFQPGDTPFQHGAAIAVSGNQSVWLDEEGEGQVTLVAGRYTVRFMGREIAGNTDMLTILVPDDEATHELPDLICGGTWVLPLRDFLQKEKNLADLADAAAAFNAIKQPATPASAGTVALATQAEVDAGTEAAKAVTPATLAGAARWANAVGAAPYETKTAAFTATAGGAYALDTSAGAFGVTIDAALPVGKFIDFADARGTWGANPPTFVRNGHLIEGSEVNYVDAAQGTFLRILNIGGTTGLRILESGSKPHNLVPPAIAGQYVGQTFTCMNGTWTGNPTGYAYQWQSSTDGIAWTDIAGATSATVVPNGDYLDAFIRVAVSASNSNGTSLPVPSAPSVQLSEAPFPPGCIAYWRLDETAGIRADATGNGHDLTDRNSVGYEPGKISNAAVFDGSNGLDGTFSQSSFSALTVAGWIKIPVDALGRWHQCFSNWSQDSGNFVLQVDDNDTVYLQTSVEVGKNGFANDIVTSGEWFFVCARWDGTRYYLRCNDLNATPVEAGDNPSLSQFGIGGNYGGSSYDHVGSLDEFGVWDRCLSDAEIDQLYNGGNGFTYPTE